MVLKLVHFIVKYSVTTMHMLSNTVSSVALCVKTHPSCEISGED